MGLGRSKGKLAKFDFFLEKNLNNLMHFILFQILKWRKVQDQFTYYTLSEEIHMYLLFTFPPSLVVFLCHFPLLKSFFAATTCLKSLWNYTLSKLSNCGLLTPSHIGVCDLNTRMASLLKWEGFICHSFFWCWSNEQVCRWWMVWPFPPLYNQVFLVDSHDSFVDVLELETIH